MLKEFILWGIQCQLLMNTLALQNSGKRKINAVNYSERQKEQKSQPNKVKRKKNKQTKKLNVINQE